MVDKIEEIFERIEQIIIRNLSDRPVKIENSKTIRELRELKKEYCG